MNGYNEKGNFAFFLLHFNQVLGLQIKQRVK